MNLFIFKQIISFYILLLYIIDISAYKYKIIYIMYNKIIIVNRKKCILFFCEYNYC